MQQITDLLGDMRRFLKEPGNLKEYSPWLSGFKAHLFGSELEIPGQHSQKLSFTCYISSVFTFYT